MKGDKDINQVTNVIKHYYGPEENQQTPADREYLLVRIIKQEKEGSCFSNNVRETSC